MGKYVHLLYDCINSNGGMLQRTNVTGERKSKKYVLIYHSILKRNYNLFLLNSNLFKSSKFKE